MVADFNDHTSAMWNTGLLQECFIPMDVEAIKSILLSTRRIEDRWAWHNEKNRVISVRSVYRLLVNRKMRKEDWIEERPSASNTAREGKEWQWLWKF